MRKHKKLFFIALFAIANALPMVLPPIQASAASPGCYFYMNGTSRDATCPPEIQPLVNQGRCFQQRVESPDWTEFNCADGSLHTQQACEGSGGVWRTAEGVPGFMCFCRSGFELQSYGTCESPLQKACTSTGGEYTYVESGPNAGSHCTCPADKTLASTGRCESPQISENGSLTITDEDGSKIIGWINTGINVLAGLAGIAITAAVIIGGIQYSTAGGNPQAASAAKKRIANALLALLAFTFLYTFLQWIVPGGVFN